MISVGIRHGWRTRIRQSGAAFVAFAGGVVAATAGAAVLPRIVGGVVFVLGTYAVLDALVIASTWRLVPDGMKIPTILDRQRIIPDDDRLAVTSAGRWVGLLVVTGVKGTRSLTCNPLVSPHDLQRWFADIAAARS